MKIYCLLLIISLSLVVGLASFKAGKAEAKKSAALERVEFDAWVLLHMYDLQNVISDHCPESFPSLPSSRRNVEGLLRTVVSMVDLNSQYFSDPANKTPQFDGYIKKARHVIQRAGSADGERPPVKAEPPAPKP